jgi:hypothetical protein
MISISDWSAIWGRGEGGFVHLRQFDRVTGCRSYGRRACHIPETIKDIWLQKTWLRANKLAVVIPVYEVDLSTASVRSATAERSQNFQKDAICHFLLTLVNLAPFCSFI